MKVGIASFCAFGIETVFQSSYFDVLVLLLFTIMHPPTFHTDHHLTPLIQTKTVSLLISHINKLPRHVQYTEKETKLKTQLCDAYMALKLDTSSAQMSSFGIV